MNAWSNECLVVGNRNCLNVPQSSILLVKSPLELRGKVSHVRDLEVLERPLTESRHGDLIAFSGRKKHPASTSRVSPRCSLGDPECEKRDHHK